MSDPVTATVPAGGQPHPQEPARPLESVELIASAVRAVPGVADLTGGRFGEYTTYLPGHRVAGVVEKDGLVTVAIIAQPSRPLLPVAAQVRAAVAVLTNDPVEVVIADLDAQL